MQYIQKFNQFLKEAKKDHLENRYNNINEMIDEINGCIEYLKNKGDQNWHEIIRIYWDQNQKSVKILFEQLKKQTILITLMRELKDCIQSMMKNDKQQIPFEISVNIKRNEMTLKPKYQFN